MFYQFSLIEVVFTLNSGPPYEISLYELYKAIKIQDIFPFVTLQLVVLFGAVMEIASRMDLDTTVNVIPAPPIYSTWQV